MFNVEVGACHASFRNLGIKAFIRFKWERVAGDNKDFGPIWRAGTKSMGGSFYSTLYKCELGLYNIVWDTKETMDRYR